MEEYLKKIIRQLSVNYKESDKENLQDILEETYSIALNASHREDTEENKKLLFPYVKEAVTSIYLRRGNEGMKSRNEGSISTTYADIIKKMKNDIVENGLRRFY